MNPIFANNLFENSNSDSHNVSEMIKILNNDENKNASNNTYIERGKNRLINFNEKRIGNSKKKWFANFKKNNLQTKKLSNSMKTSQNKTNEKKFQTASDFAKKRISKFWKHKTIHCIQKVLKKETCVWFQSI